MKWSEQTIARALALQVFNRRHLVVVPNCSYPGSECDILAVTNDLRLIDVEIKISRADFRADAKKEKWFDRRWLSRYAEGPPAPDMPRLWPHRVWKHYYCMPAEIWKPDMLAMLPSSRSGVLTVRAGENELPVFRMRKPARPDRNADKISVGEAVNIARLASLRMWEAYMRLDQREAA